MSLKTPRNKTGKPAIRGRRRGVATAELAVCLPTMIFVFMVAIQATDVLFLQQTLHVAGYEAARVAIRPEADTTAARAAGTAILNARGVVGGDVAFAPLDVAAASRGENVVVTVTAPASGNTVLPTWFFGGRNLVAETTMVKE